MRMARIPDAFIDDLLARTDIVEVISTRVPLKRQGKEYSARCPFHDERSASFTVSPTKQFYHCFGCGAHGTAISFLMNYDRLEFLDAVDELAKRAGMEVPRDTQQRSAAEQDDSRDLYAALDAAARFFQKHLEGSAKAAEYLDGRGVDAKTRARFSIGYAPEGYSALKDALGTDERRMKLLDRAGLFSKNDRGHVYDKFRDRVMFPIFDRRGRVIAFGGRVLQKDDGPKYLNSPETALFHKGRELYGLWQVRQAHQKIERLIVVEGYMDVVSLFQYGVTEAVATLGTATTPEHAELLFRNAPDVYFCFDGDNAGRKAGWRALESVLPRMKDGRQAYFLFLPDGEDPDTIVRKEGRDGFDQRLKQATPLSQFFFDEMSREINLHTLDGRARLAERARPMLAQIPDGAFGDLMRQQLSRMTGVGIANPDSATPPRSRGAPGHPHPQAQPGTQRHRHPAAATLAGQRHRRTRRLRRPAPARRGTAARTGRAGAAAPGNHHRCAARTLCRARGTGRVAETRRASAAGRRPDLGAGTARRGRATGTPAADAAHRRTTGQAARAGPGRHRQIRNARAAESPRRLPLRSTPCLHCASCWPPGC